MSFNIPGLAKDQDMLTWIPQQENRLLDATNNIERLASELTNKVDKTSANNVSNYTGNANYVSYPLTSPIGIDPHKILLQLPLQNPFDVQKIEAQQEFLKRFNESVKKTPTFEDIILQVFSHEERIDFLRSMGYDIETNYHVTISRKLADGSIVNITTPLDQLFLMEVTIKFKNLLLSKATLKLKL